MGLTRTEAAARAAAARRDWAATRTCLECAADYIARTPNARHCPLCAEGRRRDHYRRKNYARTNYIKVIRSLPIGALWERDGGRCGICTLSVDRFLSGLHPGMPSYDHVVPVSLGGSDDPSNLRLAHLRCNIARGNRLL